MAYLHVIRKYKHYRLCAKDIGHVYIPPYGVLIDVFPPVLWMRVSLTLERYVVRHVHMLCTVEEKENVKLWSIDPGVQT